jgi:hypothetical protein
MSGTETAHEQAAGLRRLADMIEANPEIAADLRYALYGMVAPLVGAEQRERTAAIARAATRAGAKVDKEVKNDYDQFTLAVTFGPVRIRFLADRDEVCRRIVTGIREVTKEVPDPEALAAVPTVTVTETVEDVEWKCTPLLAEVTS